tara:strand:- start:18 stop:2783 length:2766 start_codon:yes stop_codon:yes gene_type:complete
MKKKFIFSVLFCFGFLLSFGQTVDSKFKFIKKLADIEEYLYEPNGLSILLIKDNSTPVVTTQITYSVGSKHEVSGNTGSTHLLEHLLFKGTPKYNKKTQTIASALQNVGARMNATTWYDRTNYYETIPSDYLELALDIEADRMRNSFLKAEDKAAEMTVVRNEFERGENNPSSLLSKEIWATAFKAHTYHHSTIGWRSDIENAPIEKLKEFYNTYYWPNNATLSIIGDFNTETVFQLVDTYFGVIEKSPNDFPQPYTEEPQQFGPRKTVIKKPGKQGLVVVAFKSPGKMHKDHAALSVLSDIIRSGASSVLNKTFVDTGLALYAYSALSSFKEHNLFSVGAGFAESSNHEDINEKIILVLNNIKKNGVAQVDLDRVVAKSRANDILRRDGSFAIAGVINEAIAAGDWTNYITDIVKLSQVSIEDIKRVANTYLLEDQSTTGYFIPKTATPSSVSTTKGSQNFHEDSRAFFRDPQAENESQYFVSDDMPDPVLKLQHTQQSKLKYNRKLISGIDITTVKTGVKGFVNVVGSINSGRFYAAENGVVAAFAADMLLKGTFTKDKYELSKNLESLGVRLIIRAGTYKTTFSFKCLSNDLEEVAGLLADALRNPAFNEKEFELLKQQYIGNTTNRLESPAALARIKLSQLIYPDNHPEYNDSIETQIEKINSVTLSDIKTFHEKYYGVKEMHMVAVGAINDSVSMTLGNAFKGWNGGVETKKVINKGKALPNAKTAVITIEGKPNAQLLMAQYTGLNILDIDYRPFQIGVFSLGGGFSGRLMQTVRDNDGLTYSIGARHSSDRYSDGYFVVSASFNPTLIQKGEDATRVQINKWIDEGLSETELENKKSNLIGSFKVRLSTTGGLASSILSFINEGKSPAYIDEYPKEIKAVTLNQVNSAIKKYINPASFLIIKSGSIDQQVNPKN